MPGKKRFQTGASKVSRLSESILSAAQLALLCVFAIRHLKGRVSQDKYYFKGPLKEICSFYISACVFFYQYLVAFLWRKLKIKFLLTSLTSLTNSENPSCDPLQEACSGSQVGMCDSKSCSESRL